MGTRENWKQVDTIDGVLLSLTTIVDESNCFYVGWGPPERDIFECLLALADGIKTPCFFRTKDTEHYLIPLYILAAFPTDVKDKGPYKTFLVAVEVGYIKQLDEKTGVAVNDGKIRLHKGDIFFGYFCPRLEEGQFWRAKQTKLDLNNE